MVLHLEISEIRLACKTKGRVQDLSPGLHAMAGFDLTTEAALVREFSG